MATKSDTGRKATRSATKAVPTEKHGGARAGKESAVKELAEPRRFVPERAGSVIQKWYRLEVGGQARKAEALSGELRLAGKVAAGYPTRAVDDVISSGLVEPRVMYELVVSRRTLADRKQKEKLLSPEQSDRLARVLRVYARAEEAIGDMSRASRWLHKENRALEGKRPVDLLGTDAGTRAVERVLGRIEHGIVS
ncbi:type II toxin-antitoxin system Xre/ParS family antitoxin [Longimicrobium sp.]|jgi:putative toxin-antitoxin system antitoxin component (TIGR02293 family)|uniref:type II RES/Xre toxin-antitoxin system antitoxin n=1 Tax=Longimicrobium sp. TaxID=2029185 RepID=UPI002EDAACFF